MKKDIDCILDLKQEGKVIFKRGKKYPVKDEGTQWSTVDELGNRQIVKKGSEEEDRLLGTFFIW